MELLLKNQVRNYSVLTIPTVLVSVAKDLVLSSALMKIS